MPETSSIDAADPGSVEFVTVDAGEALQLAAAMKPHAAMTPFQMAGWLESIMDTLMEDGSERPLFVAGMRGARCSILLPLAIFERRGLRLLGWLGQAVSDYNGPIADRQFLDNASPALARQIWARAASLAGPVDLVYARKQPVEIAGLDNPFSGVSARSESDRAHMRRLNRPWPEIEGELVSKKSRKRLKEKQRALARNGTFEVRAVDDRDEVDHCCLFLMRWKSDQLERTGATNPFSDPSYRRFMESACRRGDLRLHAAFLDSVPLAVTCLLEDEDSWALYQTGFDPAYSRHSVGRILNIALLESASRSGIRVFDFGYGDEEYKRPLCDQSVALTYSLVPFTARGRVSAGVLSGALALRKYIKGNAQLRDGALRLRRAVHEIRGRLE
ncbi:MAG: hypothetical protein Kow0026_23540 [Oricola sp.]